MADSEKVSTEQQQQQQQPPSSTGAEAAGNQPPKAAQAVKEVIGKFHAILLRIFFEKT